MQTYTLHSLAISDIQIKTILRFLLTLVRMVKINKTTDSQAGGRLEEKGILIPVC